MLHPCWVPQLHCSHGRAECVRSCDVTVGPPKPLGEGSVAGTPLPAVSRVFHLHRSPSGTSTMLPCTRLQAPQGNPLARPCIRRTHWCPLRGHSQCRALVRDRLAASSPAVVLAPSRRPQPPAWPLSCRCWLCPVVGVAMGSFKGSQACRGPAPPFQEGPRVGQTAQGQREVASFGGRCLTEAIGWITRLGAKRG